MHPTKKRNKVICGEKGGDKQGQIGDFGRCIEKSKATCSTSFVHEQSSHSTHSAPWLAISGSPVTMFRSTCSTFPMSQLAQRNTDSEQIVNYSLCCLRAQTETGSGQWTSRTAACEWVTGVQNHQKLNHQYHIDKRKLGLTGELTVRKMQDNTSLWGSLYCCKTKPLHIKACVTGLVNEQWIRDEWIHSGGSTEVDCWPISHRLWQHLVN